MIHHSKSAITGVPKDTDHHNTAIISDRFVLHELRDAFILVSECREITPVIISLPGQEVESVKFERFTELA